jgi:hypothetical protein
MASSTAGDAACSGAGVHAEDPGKSAACSGAGVHAEGAGKSASASKGAGKGSAVFDPRVDDVDTYFLDRHFGHQGRQVLEEGGEAILNKGRVVPGHECMDCKGKFVASEILLLHKAGMSQNISENTVKFTSARTV